MRTVSLILAGGLGSRLLPVTQKIPKPLIEFRGKKLIDYTLESVAKHVELVIVTLSFKAAMVEKHIKDNWPEVVCAKEPELFGTGGSLKYQYDLLKKSNPEVVLVLVSDHIRDINFGEFVRAHIEAQNDLTILVGRASPKNDQLVVKDSIVVDYLEMGSEVVSNAFSSTGEYAFSWGFLKKQLEEKEENNFHLGEEFIKPIIISQKGRTGMFYVNNWFDVGTTNFLEEIMEHER